MTNVGELLLVMLTRRVEPRTPYLFTPNVPPQNNIIIPNQRLVLENYQCELHSAICYCYPFDHEKVLFARNPK